jgi:hypothetical protein
MTSKLCNRCDTLSEGALATPVAKVSIYVAHCPSAIYKWATMHIVLQQSASVLVPYFCVQALIVPLLSLPCPIVGTQRAAVHVSRMGTWVLNENSMVNLQEQRKGEHTQTHICVCVFVCLILRHGDARVSGRYFTLLE